MRSAFGVEHPEISKGWGEHAKAVGRSIKVAGARRGAKPFTSAQSGWGKGKLAQPKSRKNTRLNRWS